MTLFNSKPINTDPNPWTTNPGQEIGYRTEEQPWFSERNFFYDPRPEFDNNVNPVLYAFRAALANTDLPRTRLVDKWLGLLSDGMFVTSRGNLSYALEEDVEHATKVLRRLAFSGYNEDTTTEGENND